MSLFKQLVEWMLVNMPSHAFSRAAKGLTGHPISPEAEEMVVDLLLNGRVECVSQSDWKMKENDFSGDRVKLNRKRVYKDVIILDEASGDAIVLEASKAAQRVVIVCIDEVTVPALSGANLVVIKRTDEAKADLSRDVRILDIFKVAHTLQVNGQSNAKTIFCINPSMYPLVKLGCDFYTRRFKSYNVCNWMDAPYSNMSFSSGFQYQHLACESATLLQCCLSLMQAVYMDFPRSFNESAAKTLEMFESRDRPRLSEASLSVEPDLLADEGFDIEEIQEAVRRSLIHDSVYVPQFDFPRESDLLSEVGSSTGLSFVNVDAGSRWGTGQSEFDDTESVEVLSHFSEDTDADNRRPAKVIRNPVGRMEGERSSNCCLVRHNGMATLIAPKHQQCIGQTVILDGTHFDLVPIESSMKDDYVLYNVVGIDRFESKAFTISSFREGAEAKLVVQGSTVRIPHFSSRVPFRYQKMTYGMSGSPLIQGNCFVGMAVMMSARKEVACTLWNGSQFVHQCRSYLQAREMEFVNTAEWKDMVDSKGKKYRAEHVIVQNYLANNKSSVHGSWYEKFMSSIQPAVKWVNEMGPDILKAEIDKATEDGADVSAINAVWRERFIALRRRTAMPLPETAIKSEMEVNPSTKLPGGYLLIDVLIKMVDVLQVQAAASGGGNPNSGKNGAELAATLASAYSTFLEFNVWPVGMFDLSKKTSEGRPLLEDALGAMKTRDLATFSAMSKKVFPGEYATIFEQAFANVQASSSEAAGHQSQEAALDRMYLLLIYVTLASKVNKDGKIDAKVVTTNMKLVLGCLMCNTKVMRKSVAMASLKTVMFGERFVDMWKSQLSFMAGEDVDVDTKYMTPICVLTTKRMIEAGSLISMKILSRMSILILGTEAERLSCIANMFNAEYVACAGANLEKTPFTSLFLLVKMFYKELPQAYMALKQKSVLSVRIVPAGRAKHTYVPWESVAADLDTKSGTNWKETTEEVEEEEEN